MSSKPVLTNNQLERLTVRHDMLLLDNRNPRFFGEDINKDIMDEFEVTDLRLQEYLRQVIFKRYSIQDLINSIAEIGFLKLDPIITVAEHDKFRVVEGNRRLAAIKTIHGEIRRKNISVTDEVLKSITEIEVVNLKNGFDEGTVWMLQGIRHVSGIRDWGPFQQSELIKTLHVQKGMTYKQVGSILGLSPARVATIHKAYCGLSQMMNDSMWSSLATPDLFSHFEQAYVRGPVREWLEWDTKESKFKNDQNLTLFYSWITSDNSDVPREKLKSRDIRDKLPVVLGHDHAKKKFIDNKCTIEEAFSLAQERAQLNLEFKKASEQLENSLLDIRRRKIISPDEKKHLLKIYNLISEIL